MEKNESINERIIRRARSLRFGALADGLEDYLTFAAIENLSHAELLDRVLKHEEDRRNDQRVADRIKLASFPQKRYLQEIVREELPKDAQVVLPELETLDFIRKGQNIVMYGNPGTGKTHLAIALGMKACQEGFTVLFTSVPHLLTQLRECRAKQTLRSLEYRFGNYDLVICDEFGYVSCDKDGGELLFNHLSLRAGGKSTIVTTNLAFNRWDEIIQDKVLVSAMVDRITHRAYLINMTGKSYRLKETEKINSAYKELIKIN